MPSDETFNLTTARRTGDSISNAMSPDKSLAKPPRPRPRDAGKVGKPRHLGLIWIASRA